MGTDGALVAPAVFKTVCVRLAADGWIRFPDVPANEHLNTGQSMSKQALPVRALWSALGATAYIALVATVFAFHLFGIEDRKVFAPMVAMLLLVFSVLVMGTLLLLPPLRLYLDGRKPEGVRLLLFTAMWMGIFLVLAVIVMSVV